MRGSVLRDLLRRPTALCIPGVHDGLSARLVAQAGFQAAFVSGAGVSMSRLGQADLAFLGLSELCDGVRAIALASDLPLIVDIDTGFGNAHNGAQAMRMLERVGASAVQIEDQTFPKRCGHLTGKTVIPADEMVTKIRALHEARTDPDTMIIARTDALAVTTLDDALVRCDAYLAAGADALFVEAPSSIEQMAMIATHVANRAPLVHNFVEGGNSPIADMIQLCELGYKIGLFPLVGLHAAVPAHTSLLSHLKACGQTQSWEGPKADLPALNALVGLPDLLVRGGKYG